MQMPPLTLGSSLQRVVRGCETVCVAACCGLDAFDFHPIHVASTVLACSDPGPVKMLERIAQDLRDLERHATDDELDEFGCLGWCENLNTTFTPERLRLWISQMHQCLADVSKLFELSESLGYRSINDSHS